MQVFLTTPTIVSKPSMAERVRANAGRKQSSEGTPRGSEGTPSKEARSERTD